MMQGVGNDARVPKDAAPLITEYLQRQSLAELGFTESLDDLPAWKADVFTSIRTAIESEKAKAQEKALGRKDRPRP